MNKFFGEILVLISSIGIMVICLIGGGFIIYGLANHQLGALTETSYPEGWVAFLLTIISSIYGFIYSGYSLRLVSLSRSSKKTLFLALPFLLLEVSRLIYIEVVIKYFLLHNVYIILIIINFTLIIIQIIGAILNYKKHVN